MSVRFLAWRSALPLRIEVRGRPPDRDPSIEQAWRAACNANARLFDGEILAVRSIDASAGVVHATPERFAHVVCPPPGRALPVTILSVTGVLEAVIDDQRCVLMGRRGERTRSYPGMWEFAPAGGLHPAASPAMQGIDEVLVTLRNELCEEIGIEPGLGNARVAGLVVDPLARSVDVVVRAEIDAIDPLPVVDEQHEWECAEARWVPIASLAGFFRDAPGGVIEPTIAIADEFGWLG